MALFRRAQRPLGADDLKAAVQVALRPDRISEHDTRRRQRISEMADALVKAAEVQPSRLAGRRAIKAAAVPISVVAQRAAAALQPSEQVIPAVIEDALRAQGLDMLAPFAPGKPLTPYYGFDRKPRLYDYMPARNVTTDTRPDRLPFATLKEVFEGYDVAQICARHIINDLRSMKLDFSPAEGYEGDVTKEIAEARRRLRYPDGKRPFVTWLGLWWMDVLRYDAGCLYRQRDRAGNVTALKVVSGATIAPVLDYFGDVPEPPAPAFQQIIEGVPWDWLSTDDLIYQPQWPIPESPYGVAPLETILLNANTDVRLQWFFLQFFTAGSVPEMLLQAPPDMSDPDSLAEWQETWDDWYEANQSGRHGARWVPHGAQPFQYKQITQIDPRIAEYVMRRTIAAFSLVPQDLGIVQDVNRSTAATQEDTQFRINTLPNTEYGEAILNPVIQDDWGLPVACHFDTGREREDRLMEARAHQIYVSIGAESPDEVRANVLGLVVDNDARVPRLFDSRRLGPIPLEYLYSVAGKIDPASLGPVPGSVEPEPYEPPAAQNNNPEPAVPGSKTPANGQSVASKGGWHPDLVKSAAEDLRRWRTNARKRVALGQSPRWFVSDLIPPVMASAVWSSLEGARTRAEVDEAFAKAVMPDPKGRPGPWGHLEAELVRFWAAAILPALKAVISPLAVVRQWRREFGAVTRSMEPDGRAPLVGTFAHNLDLNDGDLHAVIQQLYADAWLAGGKDALSHGSAPGSAMAAAVADVDWDTWTPGHPEAADLLAGTGFDEMLAEAHIWLKEIDDTTRGEIAKALEAGLRAGDSIEAIAVRIEASLGDMARAQLIAVTEVNRAMSLASVATYQRNGVTQFDLLTAPGACPVCTAIAAANPHPIADRSATPPVHPRCRCALAPVV